jgi:ribonuclease VapC
VSEPVVLDASAVLALLQGEAGAGRVAAALEAAAISAVNLSEVAAKLAEAGVPEGAARDALDALGMEVVVFEAELAWAAGRLRTLTRAAGLSLGDRACLALGSARSARVLTADRAWIGLVPGVRVEVIR